jgi:hypothetical protein
VDVEIVLRSGYCSPILMLEVLKVRRMVSRPRKWCCVNMGWVRAAWASLIIVMHLRYLVILHKTSIRCLMMTRDMVMNMRMNNVISTCHLMLITLIKGWRLAIMGIIIDILVFIRDHIGLSVHISWLILTRLLKPAEK